MKNKNKLIAIGLVVFAGVSTYYVGFIAHQPPIGILLLAAVPFWWDKKD